MIEPYVTEKQCQTCKQCKPITEFHNQATSPGGKKPNCKVCANADCRARYQKKVEKGGKRNRDGRLNPPQPLWEVPAHDYTEPDIAWRTTRLPAFGSLGVRL